MTEQTASAKLDRMMLAIQNLLAQADHPNTSETEAATFRAKAESLMAKFRISETELNESATMPLTVPVFRTMPAYPTSSPYRFAYLDMLSSILWHCGVRAVMRYGYDATSGQRMASAHMCGYESDLRYAELLYTAARTFFMSRMEPGIQAGLSDQENVYGLRSAGTERIRIAEMMGWGTTGSATAKVTRLYKAECEKRGEDPKLTGRSVSVKSYRAAFAKSFPTELNYRLYQSRDAAARDYSGGLPVLANRAEKVNEAFYQRHPDQRPSHAPAAPIDPKQAKKNLRAALAEMARERKLMESTSGRLGERAGTSAAQMVDLGGNDAAKRIDPSN
jgi:hypothetical protein